MALSNIQGTPISSLSAILGTAKASIASINGNSISGSSSWLFGYDFEGAGTPVGITVQTGTWNFDYTTTVLQGAQSCSTSTTGYCTTTISATGTIEVYAMIRMNNVTSNCYLFGFYASGLAYRGGVRVQGGKLYIEHSNGTTFPSVATVDSVSTNTTYHVWVSYAKGTGANGTGSVAFSTTGTRPLAGNAVASITNGSGASDITQCSLEGDNAATWIFDYWIGSLTPIGDNPVI